MGIFKNPSLRSSNQSLIGNRSSFALPVASVASGGAELLPSDLASLIAWWDPDDTDNRSVQETGTPIYLTLTNKKAGTGGIMNDSLALGPGGLGTTGRPLYNIDTINSRDALGFGDNTESRTFTPSESISASKDIGTDPWRLFMVVRQTTVSNWFGVILNNGITAAGYGGFILNASADGRLTFGMGSSPILSATSDNNPFSDQQPHVIMCGRTLGGGAAGVDRYTLRVDNQAVPGITDLVDFATTGTSSCSNSIHPVASARYITYGATAAAPPTNAGQAFLDNLCIGETVLAKQDLTLEEESGIYNYLKNKWGVA